MLRRVAVAAWVVALAPAAHAHDSWIVPSLGKSGRHLLHIELNVGDRFPVREGATPIASVRRAACRTVAQAGREVPLVARVEHANTLELRAQLDVERPWSCWVRLREHEVSLTPDLVAVYLAEIRAPATVRQAWASQHAKGAPWREVYRKFMRAEGAAQASSHEDVSTIRRPHGEGLELLPLGQGPLRVGQPLTFAALLDGMPVPGLAVELVSERSALGVWRETDTKGHIEVSLPFTGQWLLRAVRLEPPTDDAQPWRSQFATLSIVPR